MSTKKSKEKSELVVLDQWIEVRVLDGKTTTELFPPNQELIAIARAMNPLPGLVYRRFNFLDGVPAEYHWTTRDENIRRYGGIGIQRIAFKNWIAHIQTEPPQGPLRPVPGGNVPRPRERGGCDCPVCARNQS